VSFLCGHEGRTQALQEVLRVEVEAGMHVGKAVEGRGEGVGGGLDGPDEVREGGDVVAPEVGAAEGTPAAGALGRRQDLGQEEPPPGRGQTTSLPGDLPRPLARCAFGVAPGRTTAAVGDACHLGESTEY